MDKEQQRGIGNDVPTQERQPKIILLCSIKPLTNDNTRQTQLWKHHKYLFLEYILYYVLSSHSPTHDKHNYESTPVPLFGIFIILYGMTTKWWRYYGLSKRPFFLGVIHYFFPGGDDLGGCGKKWEGNIVHITELFLSDDLDFNRWTFNPSQLNYRKGQPRLFHSGSVVQWFVNGKLPSFRSVNIYAYLMWSTVRFVIRESDMAVKDLTTTSPIYACVQWCVDGSLPSFHSVNTHFQLC